MQPVYINPRGNPGGWLVMWLMIIMLVLLFLKDPSLLVHMVKTFLDLVIAFSKAVSA